MTLATQSWPITWTSGELRRLARRALLPLDQDRSGPPDVRSPSDFDLNPDALAELGAHIGQRPAAVLVPVIARSEPTLLFTRRTEHLPSHAGQIAFPGGKIDENDDGPIATALREAEEEVGLDRTHVEPIGYLDAYQTGTGYRIVPVVAMVSPELTLSINEAEVAEAFEVPLSFLMEASNFITETRLIAGRERRYYAIPFGRHYIWGATAGILKNMHERLLSP